jgi:hypothetical protein
VEPVLVGLVDQGSAPLDLDKSFRLDVGPQIFLSVISSSLAATAVEVAVLVVETAQTKVVVVEGVDPLAESSASGPAQF